VILGFLADIFHIIKFLFGLGALFALLGIGLALVWFAGHVVARSVCHNQPPERCVWLRKLFLDS